MSELKPEAMGIEISSFDCFDRTVSELKRLGGLSCRLAGKRFDRTVSELKPGRLTPWV